MKFLDHGLFGYSYEYVFTHPWIIPGETCKRIKWFCQRGWRGYSDRDTWSIDGYLNSILIPMLTDLRNRHIGYPEGLAEDEWDLILSQIVMGLEANQRICDLDYDDEILEALQLMSNRGLFLLGKYWNSLWD
jgi:hypothetical protein